MTNISLKRELIFPTSILWFHLDFRTLWLVMLWRRPKKTSGSCDDYQCFKLGILVSVSWWNWELWPQHTSTLWLNKYCHGRLQIFLAKMIKLGWFWSARYICHFSPEVFCTTTNIFVVSFGSMHICLETSRKLSFSVTLWFSQVNYFNL